MARIRDDYVFGTLGVALGTGGTTLTSTGLENLAAVTAPDVAAITIYDGNNYEIVHVTAHTAAADTATILRGQEGTAAQAWDAGTTWLQGLTVADINDISSTATSSGALAHKTAGATQSVPAATHTAVTLSAEAYDDAAYHDTATNTSRLTVPVTGRYRVSGQMEYAANATGSRWAIIWKNGVGAGSRLAQCAQMTNTDSTDSRIQVVTPMVELAAGDYVELGAYQSSGGALNVTAGSGVGSTWLCIERIS